jgi:hypothetical protein
MKQNGRESRRAIYTQSCKDGRATLACFEGVELEAGKVRLAVSGPKPLDVRPIYTHGRAIVDLRTGESVGSIGSRSYVVSDSGTGMRLVHIPVEGRGKLQARAKAHAIECARLAGGLFEAAESGDSDAIEGLFSIRNAPVGGFDR